MAKNEYTNDELNRIKYIHEFYFNSNCAAALEKFPVVYHNSEYIYFARGGDKMLNYIHVANLYRTVNEAINDLLKMGINDGVNYKVYAIEGTTDVKTNKEYALMLGLGSIMRKLKWKTKAANDAQEAVRKNSDRLATLYAEMDVLEEEARKYQKDLEELRASNNKEDENNAGE